MDILHHHLETVEASCFRALNFSGKSLSEIFDNNTIGGGKEGKNMLDKMSLIIIEFSPIFEILGKIDFFSGPEAGHLILIHLPDIVVLDWKNDESIWVLLKKWLGIGLSQTNLRGALLSWSHILGWDLYTSMLTHMS